MRAINKYLLIKRSNEEVKTSGGLLMSKAEESQMRYQVGVVIRLVAPASGCADLDDLLCPII